MSGLPDPVRQALDRLSEGVSGRALAERAEAISRHYRSGGGSAPVIQGALDALAYAVTRMPATYAATAAALGRLAVRAPEFAPRAVVDIGCGAGAATWAARACFGSAGQATLIDANPALLDLAIELLTGSGAEIEARRADATSTDIPPGDLILASYVLTELADPVALALAERMWAACTGAVVIVEPGTPRGWARLMAIRERIIALGAVIAAPCPHAAPCPVQAPDWCHFSQRLPRLRAHRLAKGGDAPFEDEKYAYLVLTRPEVGLAPPRSRILTPPTQDKAAITLKLCEPNGALSVRSIPRRDKDALRTVRRLDWGDEVG